MEVVGEVSTTTEALGAVAAATRISQRMDRTATTRMHWGLGSGRVFTATLMLTDTGA